MFIKAEILIKSNYPFAVLASASRHGRHGRLGLGPWLICPFEFTGECLCICVQKSLTNKYCMQWVCCVRERNERPLSSRLSVLPHSLLLFIQCVVVLHCSTLYSSSRGSMPPMISTFFSFTLSVSLSFSLLVFTFSYYYYRFIACSTRKKANRERKCGDPLHSKLTEHGIEYPLAVRLGVDHRCHWINRVNTQSDTTLLQKYCIAHK